MSFIQREIDKINLALNSPAENRDALYAAQQALEWALEPDGIMSPFDMITGTQEDLADCSVHPRQPQS